MGSSVAFRIVVLVLWLLSSVGGLIYAYLHYRSGRTRWAEQKWRGDPDESGARFWRLSARALLIYFVLVVVTGLIALFWPAPPQPLRFRTALNTFVLIASNLTVVWLIRLLRDYGRNLVAKGVSQDRIGDVLAEFEVNTGHTMRDAIDRLEVEINKLKDGNAVQTALGDRLERLVLELGEKADIAAAAAQVIAKNLEEAKVKVEAVEADLAEAHRRADAIADDGQPGEAADAASRMTEAEKDKLGES